jgi:hypothetical protein
VEDAPPAQDPDLPPHIQSCEFSLSSCRHVSTHLCRTARGAWLFGTQGWGGLSRKESLFPEYFQCARRHAAWRNGVRWSHANMPTTVNNSCPPAAGDTATTCARPLSSLGVPAGRRGRAGPATRVMNGQAKRGRAQHLPPWP